MKHLLTALLVMLTATATAQRGYTEKADTSNPRRKIVVLKPVTQRLALSNALKNVLEEDAAGRKPIAHQAFEMKNPRTGKPLNPDTKMTLKLADGSTRSTTVKEFFAQVNELEKQLNTRGRSLRMPNTLAGLKPKINQQAYMTSSAVKYNNYSTNNFKMLPPQQGGGTGTFMPMQVKTTAGTGGAGALGALTSINPDMYVAETTSDYGTTEFPATWVKTSMANRGRAKFPVIGRIMSLNKGAVTKIVWQVHNQPFNSVLNTAEVPGLVKSIEQTNITWMKYPRGWESLPEKTRKIMETSEFFGTTVDMAAITPYPGVNLQTWFIRAVLYGSNNQVLTISPAIAALYGHTENNITITATQTNSAPGFQYSFPENKDIPFGMYIRGSGINTSKGVENTVNSEGKPAQAVTVGYKVDAHAALGIRYFNFDRIINNSAPLSNEYEMISARFTGVAGGNTGPGGKTEPNGIRLDIAALNGAVKVPYEFTEMIPGTQTISLNKSFTQSLDIDLLNTRFMLGPVPIKITASLRGEAGINLSGQFNMLARSASGEIKPYLNTRFTASGGVDAVIAYATLNAEVNPLLSLDMPLRFSSSGDKPLSFSTNISGLTGRVYLKAGFYYPCPSLEKIVGWLSGDEELPLCECAWEFNIFDFPGFTHTIAY